MSPKKTTTFYIFLRSKKRLHVLFEMTQRLQNQNNKKKNLDRKDNQGFSKVIKKVTLLRSYILLSFTMSYHLTYQISKLNEERKRDILT